MARQNEIKRGRERERRREETGREEKRERVREREREGERRGAGECCERKRAPPLGDPSQQLLFGGGRFSQMATLWLENPLSP